MVDLTFVHGTLDPASDPHGYAAVRERGPSAVAIGKFDSVHRGHRALLSRLLVEARRLGCAAGVVTFDAPPAEVLRGARPARLTTLSERRALCAKVGMDFMFALESTPALFETEPEDFAAALITRLDIRVIVVGADFHFGRAARGDVATLRSVASRLGVEVIGIALEARCGDKVSSTRIREELAAGRVEGASELLGRPFSMSGTVSQSTARSLWVDVPQGITVPAPGVYLARIAFAASDCNGDAVLVKVDDAGDGQRRLRLLAAERPPDVATPGTACTVVFERSAHGGSASTAVKRAVPAH